MEWIDAIAEAWEKEYPGLDTGPLPPFVRLARLAVLLDAFQAEVLGPFELTPSDYGVLAALRRAGAPYELSPSKLYSRLDRSSGGMTKMLRRLEERGLVRRAPDPADGRGTLVSLTRTGRDLQERVFRAFLDATHDVALPLSTRKRSEIDRSLRGFLEVFETYFEAAR